MPKTSTSGSHGVFIFSFLKGFPYWFTEWLDRFASPQQWMPVPLSPQPHQHLLSIVLLILAMWTRVKQDLRFLLTCISLIVKNDEYFWGILKSFLFIYFCSYCLAAAENSLFISLAYTSPNQKLLSNGEQNDKKNCQLDRIKWSMNAGELSPMDRRYHSFCICGSDNIAEVQV